MIRALAACFVVAAMAAMSPDLAAQGTGPCVLLSYWNRSGSEYIHLQNLPTAWYAVRMTPAYEADVDTAYIGFGIVKHNTATQLDSLEVRVLDNTLPVITQLDYFKAAIPANLSGEIPDDYWVVEFQFDNNAARITPARSFWLAWRLVGPAADEAHIRLMRPGLDSGRSNVILPSGGTQTITNYVSIPSMRDTVDLMAETHVCYYNQGPVELASFSAEYRGERGVLRWTTASETHNFGFDVQRAASSSTDGRMTLWQTLGFVNGHGSTTEQQEYSFVDPAPQEAAGADGTVRYRLRQIDYDGTMSYSGVCELAVPGASSGVALGASYPSPAMDRFIFVPFSVPDTRPVRFTLIDAAGRIVAELPERIYERGRHTASLQLRDLAPGSYQCAMTAGTARVSRSLTIIR